MSDKLLPCPFCGRQPKLLQRPDSLDGFFCAISCFCGGYSARAHQFSADKESADVARKQAITAWNRRAPATANAALTLDELRGMDGEPVWVTNFDGSGARWGIVDINKYGVCANVDADTACWFDDICKTIAYRRKPEGGVRG